MKPAVDKLDAVGRDLAAASGSAQAEVQRLRLRIGDVRRALEHARVAPVPVAEILRARIPATVKEAAAHCLEQRGRQVVEFLGEPMVTGSVRLPWRMDGPLPWDVLCAAAPDLATTILTRLVEQVPYAANVPSLERPAHVERLEVELVGLEQAEERLVDQACAAGVPIDHRPEVASRRAQEVRQAQRDEELAAERRRRQVGA